MSDFRKMLLAFAAVTLLTGIASAQVVPPITCSTTAQPLTVRAEGLTEQTGDVVIACTGGSAPRAGDVLATVNISITLSTNITSRFLNDPLTEALLFIDDPAPTLGVAPRPTVMQVPCYGRAGAAAVCAPYMADGAGNAVEDLRTGVLAGTGSALGGLRNVFQGSRQNDNTVVFAGVPIVAPGTQGTRIYRIKNIRAAIAGASATNGQIFAFVSIQNPPTNLQLNNSTANVAFVQTGLAFAVRSRTGGGFSATGAGVFLFQCDNFNTDLVGGNTEDYNNTTTSQGGRSITLRYREGYAAAFKVRDVNPPLTEPGLQQNIPENNNGADPGVGGGLFGTVVESGFYNTNYLATNGMNRAGRADHGTRLRAQFNNVPANSRIYVSTHSLAGVGTACGNDSTVARFCRGGETSGVAAAYAVSTTSGFPSTIILTPTSTAEGFNTESLGSIPAGLGFPVGAVPGLIEVPIVAGSGQFFWEIFRQDPTTIDTVSFAVAVAFRSANNPGTGAFTINGSFAPISTVNTMSASAPIPRFQDQSTATNGATINVCRTNLLFPFTSNQAGFDTGVAIANTSSDPFGTSAQSGNCTLNYYGGTTGGGAAPSAQTTTTALAGGSTAVFTLSSGGTNGIAGTPGFQGYIIAVCNFRYAHGFAYVSDVGSQRLAHGYLALILDSGPESLNRTSIVGENLNN